MSKRILLIVTSHSKLGNTGRATGLYLPELAHPYEVFEQAGFWIDVASPNGGNAPIDPNDLSDDLCRFGELTKATLPLHQIDPGTYDAFFIVGGHGAMWDLPNNTTLQRMLSQAYAHGKIIAAVCHGPAALVNLKDTNKESFLRGKQVTGFTNHEEFAVNLTEIVPFLLEDQLKQAGAKFIGQSNWQEHVVVDNRLVTGQNPASAYGVAKAVTNLLCPE